MEKIKEFLNPILNYLRGQFSRGNRGSALVRTYSGEETWIASASYIPFISAAVLVLRKNNSEFVSFHARHALVILIISILALLLLPMVLKMVAAVAAYAILVYGAYQAIRGRKWYLPIVTELAQTFDI